MATTEQVGGNVTVIIANISQPEPLPRSNPDMPPITINPERLGGSPTIAGTRMPVVTLIDYLSAGHTVEEFAAEFEIELGDIEAVLMKIRDALEAGFLAERTDR